MGISVSLSGHHIAATAANATYVRQPYQALNPFVIDMSPHVFQFGLYADTSIGAITHLVNLTYFLCHRLVGDGTLARRVAVPSVVGTGRNLEVFAEGLHR